MSEDLPGIQVVLTWTIVFLAMLALYQWLPVTLWVLRRLRRTGIIKPTEGAASTSQPSALDSKPLWAVAWLLAAMIWGTLAATAFGAGRMKWELVFAFSIFSLLLSMCMFFFLRYDVRKSLINWRGPLVFLAVSILLPVVARNEIAEIMDSSLRRYRFGGMLPVTVESIEPGAVAASLPVAGKLVLLGKRNIYIETGEGSDQKLIVIVNSQNLKVTIGRLDRAP